MHRYQIHGFNPKEQQLFFLFVDQKEHTIKECQDYFEYEAMEHCEANYEIWDPIMAASIANSFVRNSLRKLIKDGWIIKCGKGTYILTAIGAKRIEEGVQTTPSAAEGRKRRKVGRYSRRNKVVKSDLAKKEKNISREEEKFSGESEILKKAQYVLDRAKEESDELGEETEEIETLEELEDVASLPN